MAAVAELTNQTMLLGPPGAGRSEQRLFEPVEVTLEDWVLEVWEDLGRSGCAECPVCGGALLAASGCESCGSVLS